MKNRFKRSGFFMLMDYGRVAKFYQIISRAVFGSALIDAQIMALSELAFPCKLLLVGGGDGEILKHMSAFEGEIDYVEISSEMVKEAKAKTDLPINWFIQDIFTYSAVKKFDVLLLPFVLDNFTTLQCDILLHHLTPMVKNEGTLIVVDFTEKPVLWQKCLISVMYTFFRWVSNVKVNEIPSIEETMRAHNWHKTLENKSFRGFIEVKKYGKLA
jgi:ubiquinone/menaquinone biosynthesis C-methylase UbiE